MKKVISGSQIALFILLGINVPLFGQWTGTILDEETGLALKGVDVLSKNGNTISNQEGRFSLNVEANSFVLFNYLGYNSDSVFVADPEKHQIIYLTPSSISINPVVVNSPLLYERLQSMPSSVSVLNKRNIEISGNASFLNNLNSFSGVNVQQGALNTSRITVRGMGARTPYATNRIKAYFNEIPMTSGDGTTIIEDIDPSFIQSITLVKGAKSAFYGSGLGGILQISSKNYLQPGTRFGANVETGGFGTVKPAVWMLHGKNDFSVSSGYSYLHSDGYRENSMYDRHNAHLNLSLSKKSFNIKYLLHYINVHAFIPSSINEETFINNPQEAAPNWKAVKGFEQYSRLIQGLKSEISLSENMSNTTILFGTLNEGYESRPFNILDDNSFQLGVKSYLSYKTEGLSARLGVDLLHEKYLWKIFETLDGVEGELQNQFEEIRHPLSFFLHLDILALKNTVIEAGLSYNINKYQLKDILMNPEDLSGKHEFESMLSPFIGINYSILKQLNVFGSVSHGFSLPTVEETLLPSGMINPELKPESGINTELGSRFQTIRGNFYVDLTAYVLSVKNLLVTKRLSEEIFYGENAGKTLHKGIELMSAYSFNHSYQYRLPKTQIDISAAFSNHTFQEFIDDDEDFRGNSIPGIPSTTVTSTVLLYYKNGIYGNLNYRFSGSQYMNDSNTEMYEGFQVLSGKVGWIYNSGKRYLMDIYFGVENIFDKKYASMILINAPPFGGAAPRYYYPGLPRYFYGGVKISY